jgi:hypothetical protein
MGETHQYGDHVGSRIHVLITLPKSLSQCRLGWSFAETQPIRAVMLGFVPQPSLLFGYLQQQRPTLP